MIMIAVPSSAPRVIAEPKDVPNTSSLPIYVAMASCHVLVYRTDSPRTDISPSAKSLHYTRPRIQEIPARKGSVSPPSGKRWSRGQGPSLVRKITSPSPLPSRQWPARLLALTPGKDSPKQRQKRHHHHHVRTPTRQRRRRKANNSPTCYNASATRSTSQHRHHHNSHQPKQAPPGMARHHPHNPTRPMVPRRHRRRHNNRLPSPSPTRAPEAQGNIDDLPQRLDHLLYHRLHA